MLSPSYFPKHVCLNASCSSSTKDAKSRVTGPESSTTLKLSRAVVISGHARGMSKDRDCLLTLDSGSGCPVVVTGVSCFSSN